MRTMQVSDIQLYNILKVKMGESEAQTLVEYIDTKVEKEVEEKKDVLATKQDISELRVEVSKTKADIIKWMFVFWIGLLGAVIAITKLL